MFGEGVRDEVVVMVAVGLDGAVTTNQFVTCLTVDLDRLCWVPGTQSGHPFRSHHFRGCFLHVVETGDLVTSGIPSTCDACLNRADR